MQLKMFEQQAAIIGELQPGQACPVCDAHGQVAWIIYGLKKSVPYCSHCGYDGGANG